MIPGYYDREEVDLGELYKNTYVDYTGIKAAEEIRRQMEESCDLEEPVFDPRLWTCIVGAEDYVFK